MSFNGSGTFAINSTGQPVVSGTVISSSTFNALTADLATGLSTCLTKDGQTTVTANIPMNSYKITGLAAGTAATDAARVGQLQAGGATLITVAGTDTYTGTMSPSLGAYAAGNVFTFVVPNTNTTAATLNIDGLGAKALTRDGSTALVAGDLVANAEVAVVYDGTRFQVLNSNSKTNFNLSGTLTVAGNTTLSGGTANGVAYLNASKVLTTGSALTFDGTNLGIGRTPSYPLDVAGTARFGATSTLLTYVTNNGVTNTMVQIGDNPTFGAGTAYGLNSSSQYLYGQVAGVEGMRLTSTGLGIGTSSPAYKLDVRGGLIVAGNGTIVGGISYSTRPEIGAISNHPVGFITNNTTQMLLDTSGNLGIGTSSPSGLLTLNKASGAYGLNLDGGGYGTLAQFGIVNVGSNNNSFIGSISNNNFLIKTNNSIIATFDTSGNLGIGVTPSAWSSYRSLSLGNIGSSIAGQTAANGTVFTSNAYYNAGWKYAATAAACFFDAGNNVGGGFTWNQAASGTAGNAITFTQAMTLDASGNLLVGVTSGSFSQISKSGSYAFGVAQTSAGNNVLLVDGAYSSGTQNLVVFAKSGTSTGTITYNGTVVAYNTTSDYRLKEFVAPVTNAGERIDALNPVEFDWKSDGSRARGFFAHEFQQVYASSVNGTKDAVDEDGNPVYQTMQASTAEVIADLVAEIKSLRVRLNALENK